VAVIETRNVVKRYETGGETLTALKGIDFAVEPGEFVSIMGPSGSGKTTLLNLLGLLDDPSEGEVLLDGEDVTGLSDKEQTRARKRTIGFVFQNFYLIPTLTARENVEIPALFDRDPTVQERSVDLLGRMGLGDRLDHRPDQLSGGQKQRVAIARSLINEPRVLLADEPTGNLDRETGRQILDEFVAVTERDVAVIAVTHDELVNEYVDRVVRLVDGYMGEDAPTATGAAGSPTESDSAAPDSADQVTADAVESAVTDVLGEESTGAGSDDDVREDGDVGASNETDDDSEGEGS
jgi:putative ABC transport system ATP-binding protein